MFDVTQKHLSPSRSESNPSSAQSCRQLGKLYLRVIKDSRPHCPVEPTQTEPTASIAGCSNTGHLGPSWSALPPILDNQTKAVHRVFLAR